MKDPNRTKRIGFIDCIKSIFRKPRKGPYSTSWIGLLKDLGKDGVTAQTLENEAKAFWGIEPKN